jgi:hypothetical protein
MSGRPPTLSLAAAAAREAALGALEAEIVAEQASALARAGRRLEHALADLARFDAGDAAPRSGGDPAPRRPALLAAARKALWYLVVQREACGFRNSAEVLSAYTVPAEVSRVVMHQAVAWRRRR